MYLSRGKKKIAEKTMNTHIKPTTVDYKVMAKKKRSFIKKQLYKNVMYL